MYATIQLVKLVTKFLGIHLDEKINFVNHITEISMKVAK